MVHAAGSQHTQVGALGHALERLGSVARSNDNLDELLVLIGKVLNQLIGTSRLQAMMPPKALLGSQAKARS